jgi:hypothetical protein
LGVNTGKRRIEFLHHLAKRHRERSTPADEYVIVTGIQSASAGRTRDTHHLAQPSAHPIAFHRIADLARYGKTDTSTADLGTSKRLHDESAPGSAYALCRGAKIIPAFQPFNDDGRGVPITH